MNKPLDGPIVIVLLMLGAVLTLFLAFGMWWFIRIAIRDERDKRAKRAAAAARAAAAPPPAPNPPPAP